MTASTERVILSWSGGKDSALALEELRGDQHYLIMALLTTVTEGYDRVSMHGIRVSLIRRQAEAIGIPLETVLIPQSASNDEYESRMRKILTRAQADGVTAVAFGDVFLEDVRRYREEKLAQVGMKGLFPLWKKNTIDMARKFVESGYRAILTCVDSHHLDRSFVGREFDERLLSDLPRDVDPCGENGEFHTFVYDGPILRTPISVRKGDVVFRETRFWYCDLAEIS